MAMDRNGEWHESPVHEWFGLSYASYFTVPRSVLEAMPYEWQWQFVALVKELNETLDWGSCLPNFDGFGRDNYTVYLRDGYGKFARDPLANYRHPIPIPHKAIASLGSQ